MDESTSYDTMDASSSQRSTASAKRPLTSRSNPGNPPPSDDVWDIDMELDYDDSKLSEEERQLIADAYPGVDVLAKDYVTRVPQTQKEPKTATSGKEGVSNQRSGTTLSSHQKMKTHKGVQNGARFTAEDAYEIEQRCQEGISQMRISDGPISGFGEDRMGPHG
ncbi:MAG: hypothetical protein Q9215_005820 [Flavoplaca cf. flavocitrina]